MRRIFTFLALNLFFIGVLQGSYIMIPMGEEQGNHLKAYGITYWVLEQGQEAFWLLNYKGGSFAFKYNGKFEEECVVRGVSYEVIPNAAYNNILNQLTDPELNKDLVKLQKAPKIAVYSPKNKQPWDDAVTLAMTYAEIPYDVVYDEEVLNEKLPEYDWLHLHHEDFTGQFGRFYAVYRNKPWYKQQVRDARAMAAKFGYEKVSKLKLAVAKKIRDYVAGGGYLFAMCSATDSYDIALAAEGVDICKKMFDGDPMEPNAQKKLDFSRGFAFEDYSLVKNPYRYEFSSIDATKSRSQVVSKENDYFKLFDFSAKWDPVPTMLTQNHTNTVKGFYGQTTAYIKDYLKSDVLIMGEAKAFNEARYIHGKYGYGMWTFYGGHDPEDYKHRVGEEPTDLDLHPNSPGYRLILNNVLFPAASKKKRRTHLQQEELQRLMAGEVTIEIPAR